MKRPCAHTNKGPKAKTPKCSTLPSSTPLRGLPKRRALPTTMKQGTETNVPEEVTEAASTVGWNSDSERAIGAISKKPAEMTPISKKPAMTPISKKPAQRQDDGMPQVSDIYMATVARLPKCLWPRTPVKGHSYTLDARCGSKIQVLLKSPSFMCIHSCRMGALHSKDQRINWSKSGGAVPAFDLVRSRVCHHNECGLLVWSDALQDE